MLFQLSRQSHQISEIIVVDSQSTDNTLKIAEENKVKIIHIQQKDFDHGGTRNLAAAFATGDILIFMTQDAYPENSQTIAALIKPLVNIDIIVSYARQIPKPGTKITDRFLRLYNYPDKSNIKTYESVKEMGIRAFQNSNACSAYRRKEFELLGGFPTPIVSNEDMLFAAKAIFSGYKVAYTAEARVLHSHNYNYLNLFKRYFDIGASLSNENQIRHVGKAETKGMGFLISQLKYVIKEREYKSIPLVFHEAVFKFAGYKLGEKHNRVPKAVKKYLGLQKNFWTKLMEEK